MEKNKKIDFTIGIFDEISEEIKKKIKNESNNSELYGIGVYTDEVVIKDYMTYPVRKLDERMKLAKQLEGVDFVFSIDNTDEKEIRKIVEQACIKVLNNK